MDDAYEQNEELYKGIRRGLYEEQDEEGLFMYTVHCTPWTSIEVI